MTLEEELELKEFLRNSEHESEHASLRAAVAWHKEQAAKLRGRARRLRSRSEEVVELINRAKRHMKHAENKEARGRRLRKEDVEIELDERVLDLAQRQKRAMVFRRYKEKIERSKEIAQKHMAPDKNIKKRAYVLARQLVRKKFAGQRGAEYAQLGPSEKMSIDRIIDKKSALIKKLALRLIPKVKQAERQRLSSYMDGAALVNNHNESYNNLFSEAFKDNEKVQPNKPGNKAPAVKLKTGKETGKSNIEQFRKFSEEAEDGSSIYQALKKKADKSSVDIEILGEVYNRGLESWDTDTSVSAQQYAFARVNSFLNRGKTYYNEDSDLAHSNCGTEDCCGQCDSGELTELSKKAMGSYVKKAVHSRDNIKRKIVSAEHELRASKGTKGHHAKKKSFDAIVSKLVKRDKGLEHAIDKIAEDRLEEAKNAKPAHRLRYDPLENQWWHSSNAGFTWKRATPEDAKKAYPGKYKDLSNQHNLSEEDPCWNGYKQYGMKKKGGKKVPNCVKEDETMNEISWDTQLKYDTAARKDRLESFEKTLDSKFRNEDGTYEDHPERDALNSRVERRNFGINTVMERSNRRKGFTIEDVKTSEREPVLVPAHTDEHGNTIRAKTVMRKTGRKILRSGNVHNGKPD
jgi:hypothetical protein